MDNMYNEQYIHFDFTPTTLDDLYVHIVNSDIDVSSCIDGVNAKM